MAEIPHPLAKSLSNTLKKEKSTRNNDCLEVVKVRMLDLSISNVQRMKEILLLQKDIFGATHRLQSSV